MSGDITDMLPIPDEAGIIPRVLHNLFGRLEDTESDKCENSVKCSFIELYNEELRDLLAADDSVKLKIFDEANKNGRTTTLVQGMEETHIKNASKGIQLLREGSHKRQVAATKCNDLSSRSHTVFTVTVYIKRTSETGEDFVSSGKLNLVDLAGSENIQRSGAENKRAAEAGVINKSLLTLGRVINALVDKSSHIPYRESKLTRLLQDSLGGQTKTCIIATLSPAKSNLEETISTLDYAFRAKNIRNKPQINQTVSKKTLLKEFTSEIEKLKSELIATRQRNGVYLTAETYEEITTESESRRILSEEQRDKIETMEANLRNKVQELFILTTSFQSLKRDNEGTRVTLENTKSVLARTEIVLTHTRGNLAEETHLRKAHEETEERLASVGQDLLSTLGTTTDHVDRLHSKLRRRSELQSANRNKWTDTQSHVSGVTSTVEGRIEELRNHQEGLIASLSGRMQSFVHDEMHELQTSKALLREKNASFEHSKTEVSLQTSYAKEEMASVLGEIRTLREDVKQKVGVGLSDLSVAAQRIGAGISSELDTFHGQLQSSYVSLGREFKSVFEDLIKRMNEQQTEAALLRQQLHEANAAFISAGQASQQQVQLEVEEDKRLAASERAALLAQVTSLIDAAAEARDVRIGSNLDKANKRIKTSESEYRVAQQAYDVAMDSWSTRGQALIDTSIKSRDSMKTKLKGDWSNANEATSTLSQTTKAIHGETVRIVDDQMIQMDGQLIALDEIISRVQGQNDQHHQAHADSLGRLASNVQESYESISKHFDSSYTRTQTLDQEMRDRADKLTQAVSELNEQGKIRQPLHQLREAAVSAKIDEYIVTGETPAKIPYTYPTALPRTEAHETLLDRMRGNTTQTSPRKSPRKISPQKQRPSPTKIPSSPTKTTIFTDTPPLLQLPLPSSAPVSRPNTASSQPSLRELDVNVTAGGLAIVAPVNSSEGRESKVPPTLLKRHHTNPLSSSQIESKLPTKKSARMTVAGVAEGRENLAPAVNLSASVGPGDRRLRSRGSD